jgi:cbb3-type cytochrome oxidase subunit 1
MKADGITLDLAPPLWVPLSFFLTAPIALAAAGALLLAKGAVAVTTGFAPVTLAIAHLGTLGFLTLVMMGALYQMTPGSRC